MAESNDVRHRSPREYIAADEVHIWYVLTDRAISPPLLDAYAKLITDEEQQRCKRFYFEKHRQQCLITRALVRTTLSRYADVAPGEWRFHANPYGRPEIASPGQWASLRFNVSHTDGLVACAVTVDREVGIDVEDTRRRTATLDIARRHFSVRETDALAALPQDRQSNTFFDYWTLKESYIKARGLGLTIPLGDFTFDLRDECDPAIRFDGSIADDPTAWQFTLRRIEQHYRMAVAIRQADQVSARWRIQQTMPTWPPDEPIG